jgi:hypothetical protein
LQTWAQRFVPASLKAPQERSWEFATKRTKPPHLTLELSYCLNWILWIFIQCLCSFAGNWGLNWLSLAQRKPVNPDFATANETLNKWQ